jgi:hypothetical protein
MILSFANQVILLFYVFYWSLEIKFSLFKEKKYNIEEAFTFLPSYIIILINCIISTLNDNERPKDKTDTKIKVRVE